MKNLPIEGLKITTIIIIFCVYTYIFLCFSSLLWSMMFGLNWMSNVCVFQIQLSAGGGRISAGRKQKRSKRLQEGITTQTNVNLQEKKKLSTSGPALETESSAQIEQAEVEGPSLNT